MTKHASGGSAVIWGSTRAGHDDGNALRLKTFRAPDRNFLRAYVYDCCAATDNVAHVLMHLSDLDPKLTHVLGSGGGVGDAAAASAPLPQPIEAPPYQPEPTRAAGITRVEMGRRATTAPTAQSLLGAAPMLSNAPINAPIHAQPPLSAAPPQGVRCHD